MKHKGYPSIPRGSGQSFQEIKNAYVFDKLDGRNVSVTWSRKHGWQNFYTRSNRIFDGSDVDFGDAIPLFQSGFAEKLEKVFRDERHDGVTVYLELYQPVTPELPQGSLAGVFVPGVDKKLALFDVAPYKKCIVGPKDFLKTYSELVPSAPFIGQINWTRGFIDSVRAGLVDGLSFEGVVGKSGERHGLVMAKAKTQAWVDAVLSRYGVDEGQKLVES